MTEDVKDAKRGAEDATAWRTASAEQTRSLGASLAPLLHPGDVVVMTGDLGAGKTQFVQGVARGLGVSDDVTSPTFDLITTYDGGRMPLNHADLYRLDEAGQLDDIGYWDALEGDAATFVEWGGRFAQAVPDARLDLGFTVLDDGTRVVVAVAHGARYERLLAQWRSVCPPTAGEGASGAEAPSAARGADASGVQGTREAAEAPSAKDAGAAAQTARTAASTVASASPVAAHGAPELDTAGEPVPSGEAPRGRRYVLAMDTANESVAVGLGLLDPDDKSVRPVAGVHFHTHRQSNTQLLPQVDALLKRAGVKRGQVRAVACGRGPGSFTGVRICMSTAKGVASALGVALVGVSTMDAVAWRLQASGVRGRAIVLADAMRKEVYPVDYELDELGVRRLNEDTVTGAREESAVLHEREKEFKGAITVSGDALEKYMGLFGDLGQVADRELWVPSGASLLMCLEQQWRAGVCDPFDPARHDPALLLPVYTRLSDAEENEQKRLGRKPDRDLHTGVQHEGGRVDAPEPAATSTDKVAGMDLWVDQEEERSDLDAAHGVARPLILAIESSCDETGAAVVDGQGRIVADVVASQIDFHARFGGVVPEIASRKHIEAICGVTSACLEKAAQNLDVARLTWRDLDAVGVTYAPGLVGGLVVGVAFAKGVSWAAGIPCVAVNHLEGHMYANLLANPGLRPPFVASLVSGGTTMLVHVRDWGDYEVMGQTADDAVGEAFDKVSKAMGLGYPGGPVISKLAAKGNPRAVRFPRAMMHSGDLRFSLSGLKTAVINFIHKERAAGRPLNMPDIAASFEAAVIDVQVHKAKRAVQIAGVRDFCVGGGVAANPQLRRAYERMCEQMGVRLTMPPASACTDNASMIALCALARYKKHKLMGFDGDAYARADLGKPY